MSEDILVLVDWENLHQHCKKQRGETVDLPVIFDHAGTLGRVRQVLAFVGFMGDNKKLVSRLHEAGIEPRFTMTKQNFESKDPIKNAADIHLAVTAMEFARRPGIQGFLIVSGDGGFLPLLRELKMYGKSVNILSMNHGKTMRQLHYEADSIEYYDNLKIRDDK